MFANRLAHGTRRRGIVLVLILGMLGLLALIGVTFATYAGQALVNARNYNLSESRPGAEQYMDFALGQLINDTNNPLSAIRGHSLLRDMYGNDSVFRGTTAADYGGLLSSITQTNGTTSALYFGDRSRPYSSIPAATRLTPALADRPQNYIQYTTNIPTASNSYQYYGLNFTRWILKIQNYYNKGTLTGLSQTFEIIEDDDRGSDNFSGGNHLFTLSPIDTSTRVYNNPTYNGYPGESVPGVTPKNLVSLINPVGAVNTNTPFVLDGRYMNAFNGAGLSRALIPVPKQVPGPNGNQPFPPLVPFNVAAYANFKINSALITPSATNDPTVNFPTHSSTTTNSYPTGFGNPDLIGMDEDYDSCDLENWFLALQSADGQVMIPSFHRPSILTAADWTSSLNGATLYEQMNAVAGIAKILRPRQIDNAPQFPADPSTPDTKTGKLTYDIDNDGDGQTDSVWLDLGYPVQQQAGGKLFKPLFAFMVIGQNGRLPLNTVGNLQDRDSQYAKMYTDTSMTYSQFASANTFYDAPTWDHTSHVGYSVNEINPKFALQNAPENVYNPNINSLANSLSANPLPGTILSSSNLTTLYSQVDNAGVDVALTQLRNLLAGTVPMDSLTNPLAANRGLEEGNFVLVQGQKWWVPNGLIDLNNDPVVNGAVTRLAMPAVAGRFGEPEGIPRVLSLNGTVFSNMAATYVTTPPNTIPIYLNPVRAGRSYFSATPTNVQNSFVQTIDLMDDDNDAVAAPFGSATAELNPRYDAAGQVVLGAERISRYLTPMDPSGNGQLITYMTRPSDIYDHGSGYDAWGRMSFFRYFRPPGLPQVVAYLDGSAPLDSTVPATDRSHVDIYNMPVFPPSNATSLAIPNITNNRYHSFESFRAPAPNVNSATAYTPDDLAKIAVMGAMPFDYVGNLNESGGIYSLWPTQANPTLNPTFGATMNTAQYLGSGPFVTYAGSESGPYLLGNGASVPPLLSGPMGNTMPTAYGIGSGTFDNSANLGVAQVVNGYPLGSLNKDEADEMNLYVPNRYDQQFGPSDLEWLYRKQDVDGSTLNSRLSSLAPVSFLNPADGQTRRRLFSVDSWEPNNFIWANDNPMVFSPPAYFNLANWAANGGTFPGPSTQPMNSYNSRFGPFGNASFANMNQAPDAATNTYGLASLNPTTANGYLSLTNYGFFANPNSIEVIPNPTLDAPIIAISSAALSSFPALQNLMATPIVNDVSVNPNPDYPLHLTANYNPNPNITNSTPLFKQGPNPTFNSTPGASNSTSGEGSYYSFNQIVPNSSIYNNSYYPNMTNGRSTPTNSFNQAAYPVDTPALAHRDRRINLNMPLPVANDPGEPVRQKWCRETYQLLKSILPPQAVDTPQELAALSQYVVNIIDFRDPDATMTRFVNTDLMIVPATATTPAGVQFAEISLPSNPPITSTNITDPITGQGHIFTPFDPLIALEQTNPSANWINGMTDTALNRLRPLYPVQYGMEYNPIAINEVLAYNYFSTSITGNTTAPCYPTPRFYIELVNTLSDDTSHLPAVTAATAYNTTGTATVGSGDMNLAGWDFIITPDTDGRGRPDPVTGNIPALAGLIGSPALAAYSMSTSSYVIDVTTAGRIDSASLTPNSITTVPLTASNAWGTNLAQLPAYSFGWSLDPQYGLYVKPGAVLPDGFSTSTYGQSSYIPALRGPSGPLGNTNGYGYPTTDAGPGPISLIGDGYFVIGTSPGAGASADSLVLPNGAKDWVPATTGKADFVFPNKFFADNTAMTNATLPPGNQYYWIYLRRPANPFNPASEMVVVDSFRFPYIVNLTQGQTTLVGTTYYDGWNTGSGSPRPAGSSAAPSYNEFFSVQRLQPYRGGHRVPSSPPPGIMPSSVSGALNPTVTITRAQGHEYGYTEQTTFMGGSTTTASPAPTIVRYGGNLPITQSTPAPTNYSNSSTTYFNPGGYVFDTLGTGNKSSSNAATTTTANADPQWDYFPFHDRDFNSVAELLLVPGCPPGLFTKEFAEQNFTFSPVTLNGNLTYNAATYSTATGGTKTFPGPSDTNPISTGTNPMVRTKIPYDSAFPTTNPAGHTYPYLNDEFYYTAVSVNPSTDPNDTASQAPYPTQLGGWTGTGWYKMLDFFEVPSTAIGSIGTTDAGENFDWFRQDRRPGLLNLNLIIDEEVFFGLLDDQRLNIALAQYGYYLNNYVYQNLNVGSAYNITSPALPNMATLPQIISQVDPLGNPVDPNPGFSQYTGRGYYDISDPAVAGGAVTSLAPGAFDANGHFLNTTLQTPAASYSLPIYSPLTASIGNDYNTHNTNYVGRGFSYPDPAYSFAGMGAPFTASTYSQNLITGMKSAFADFLKLRHGGSNFLFGHQAPYTPPGTLALVINSGLSGNLVNANSPAVPQFPMTPNPMNPNVNTNAVWPDKPYRSLSYPDINYTIMRPALAVPPITQSSFSVTAVNKVYGTSPLTFPPPYYYNFSAADSGNTSPIQSATLTLLNNLTGNVANQGLPTTSTPRNNYTGDPGVRFPWLDLTFTNLGSYIPGYSATLANTVPKVPPIPPRRLFAPPDALAETTTPTPGSNAGTTGDYNVTSTNPMFDTALTPYNVPMSGLAPSNMANLYLTDPYAELITTNQPALTTFASPWSNFTTNPPNTTAYSPSLLSNGTTPNYGGNFVQTDFINSGKRQHPYYRTELLQKVMNLTTVRTHQFAVWITVGFFEVVHVGTPELGLPDILGAELDAAAGRNVRYRSFFVIDRTKAAGFNPYYPGEFRNCVTYRRRIE